MLHISLNSYYYFIQNTGKKWWFSLVNKTFLNPFIYLHSVPRRYYILKISSIISCLFLFFFNDVLYDTDTRRQQMHYCIKPHIHHLPFLKRVILKESYGTKTWNSMIWADTILISNLVLPSLFLSAFVYLKKNWRCKF